FTVWASIRARVTSPGSRTRWRQSLTPNGIRDPDPPLCGTSLGWKRSRARYVSSPEAARARVTDDREEFDRQSREDASRMAHDSALRSLATETMVTADRYNYTYFWRWLGLPI